MKLREFYKFYPGSTWIKRTGHLLVMCSIGATIFLNEVQDILLQKSEKILADAQVLTEPFAEEAESIRQNIVPVVRYIEQKNLEPDIQLWCKLLFNVEIDIPRSETISATMDQVQELDRNLTESTPILELAARIIRWTNILIWFPILFIAVPWLFLDLLLTDEEAKRFTFNGLLLAALVNVGVYLLLRFTTQEFITSFNLF